MNIVKVLGSAVVAWVAALGFGGTAWADSYAYMATVNGGLNFGVVDLSTGVFTTCGAMSIVLSGIGVGSDHKLYGGEFNGNNFYQIDPTNGALTLIGRSNILFNLTGSTTSGLYALGHLGTNKFTHLYKIDESTGWATMQGTQRQTLIGGVGGISTNSNSLYVTADSTLYKIILTTGRAMTIGTAAQGTFGSEVLERGVLYGGSFTPSAIFALNTMTGAAQLVATLSGAGSTNPWGLAPIQEQSIAAKDICAPHTIP